MGAVQFMEAIRVPLWDMEVIHSIITDMEDNPFTISHDSLIVMNSTRFISIEKDKVKMPVDFQISNEKEVPTN